MAIELERFPELMVLNQTHLATIRAWRNHPSVNRFMFAQQEITADEHLIWFNNSQSHALRQLWAYCEQNELQGFLQLQQTAEQSGVYEWGFYVNPEGQPGMGTQMLRLAMHKVFSELNGHKIVGEVLDFNTASLHIHTKLGFRKEGTLRQQHRLNDVYYDVICFGLLQSEWRATVEEECLK